MNAKSSYSIAVFPYLKTSGPVDIAGVTFRSTDDVAALSDDQRSSVADIAGMLFLQDDLRIKSATYAVVPAVDLTRFGSDVSLLSSIQAVIAYLYASPHEVFGNPFLTPEHASVVVFTPNMVSSFLVRPDFHVESVREAREIESDPSVPVAGYDGLFNFRHHFWVTDGSRVYGPIPNLTLNRSQDLRADVERSLLASEHGLRSLIGMLGKPQQPDAARVLTAIRWFNESCREEADESVALVSLAIAFESLLGLPRTEKTDRLVDSIALLLGRVGRVDAWASQFYRARSEIVHEGRARILDFVATDSCKTSDGPTYQSLVSYGRRIFWLCLSTLVFGSDLARQAGLEDLLVTNEERFAQICKVLTEEALPIDERLDNVENHVDALERHKFLQEGGLKLDTMVGAARLAVEAILNADQSVPQGNRDQLTARLERTRSKDAFLQLQALDGLGALLASGPSEPSRRHAATVQRLLDVIWGYVFMHYHWMMQRRKAENKEDNGAT